MEQVKQWVAATFVRQRDLMQTVLSLFGLLLTDTKSTPVNGDGVVLVDSEDESAVKQVTWANIKATLKSYFDTLYALAAHSHTGMVDVSGTPTAGRLASWADANTIQDAGVTSASFATSGHTHSYVGLSGDETVSGTKTFSDGDPPVIAERTIAFDAGLYTALRVRVTTSAAAAALGPSIVFDLVDSSGSTVNILGLVAAEREGADNTGALVLSTSASGVTTERMRISSAGNVSLRAGGSSGTEARVGGVLYQSVTAVGNVGAGEDDLMTYAIPAGTMAANGDSIWFDALIVMANNANVKTARMYFGATEIIEIGSSGGSAVHIHVRGRIWRLTSTTQRASVFYVDSVSGSPYHVFSGPVETLSNSITIKGTGEATSNNDVQMAGFTVGYDPVNT